MCTYLIRLLSILVTRPPVLPILCVRVCICVYMRKRSLWVNSFMQSLLQKVSFYLCLRPMNNEDKMIPSALKFELSSRPDTHRDISHSIYFVISIVPCPSFTYRCLRILNG